MTSQDPVLGPDERKLYLGFIDILGFKAVLSDWDEARRFHARLVAVYRSHRHSEKMTHDAVFESMPGEGAHKPFDLTARIMSDSFIFTTSDPFVALRTAAFLQNTLMDFGLFCRGCIAFGRHIEEDDRDGDFIVVSEPLAWAAEAEAVRCDWPRIMLHESAVREMAALTQSDRLFRHRLERLLIQSEDDIWAIDPGFGIPHLDLVEHYTRRALNAGYPPKIRDKYRRLADLIDFINIWDHPGRSTYIQYYANDDLEGAMRDMIARGALPISTEPERPLTRFRRYRAGISVYAESEGEPLLMTFAANGETGP